MTKLKIFEFGACSMLDHELPVWVDWTKRVHVNKPKYYTNLVNDVETELQLCNQFDAYIFSSSIRDNDKITSDDIIGCNVVKFSRDLTYLHNIFKSTETKDKLVILLGSISANKGNTYVRRPYYAATKSYQRTFFRNIAQLDPSNYYIEYSLPSVITNMCSHGMDSKIVFDQVLHDIQYYKLFFGKSNYKLIDNWYD